MIIALLEVIDDDMEEIKTLGSGYPDVILHPLLDIIVLVAVLLSLLKEIGVGESFMKWVIFGHGGATMVVFCLLGIGTWAGAQTLMGSMWPCPQTPCPAWWHPRRTTTPAPVADGSR